MASGYVNIPGAGAPNWKGSVTTSANLPPSGNTAGDARITLDTEMIYIWSGSAWTPSSGGGGSGTVTSVSVVTANGFAGTVATPTTTPALTLTTTATGLLKGTGSAISAAIAGTDYVTPSGSITGTAGNVTASTNSTLATLTALSLPGSQVSGNIGGNAANVTGTIAIANGGTGQTSKTAAFDALQPMTAQYDLIIGGASGSGTRLSKGANNTQLTTSAIGVVAWTANPTPYSVATINSNTNAVAGTTYLCNTSGGAFTVTLPTPVSGAFVAIKDSTGSFGTNQLTIAQNASEMIEGLAASKILYTAWGAWSFFSDGTNWFMGPF